jgi:hypothetical protein
MVVCLTQVDMVVVTATTTSGEDRASDMEEEDNCEAGRQGEVGVVEVGSVWRCPAPSHQHHVSDQQFRKRRTGAVDISLNLPTHAAELLKQTFASTQGTTKTTSAEQAMPLSYASPTIDSKGKETAKVEEINEMSKATTTKIPETSHQAAEKQGNGKNPYC